MALPSPAAEASSLPGAVMISARLLSITLLMPLLSGCLVTGGSTSRDSSGEIDPAVLAQQELSRRTDLNVARVQWGLVSNATLTTYLNGLLDRIKASVPGEAPSARVQVIPLPEVVAETTAAGNIYISIGWLKSVKCEDELIALLAHEYGHVFHHHHSSDKIGEIGSLARSAYVLKSIAAKSTGGIAGDVALGFWEGVAHPVWKRDQERQADAFALDASMALRQSYTDGMKAFLERVREWEARVDAAKPAKSDLTDSLKDSHPRAEERLVDIQRLLSEKYPERVRVKAHKAEWQAILGKPDVKALLVRHKSIVEAKELIAADKAAQAVKLARVAANGGGLEHGWVASTLGEALIRSGQFDQGLAVLKQAVDGAEPNPQAAMLLAALQLAGNRPLDAKATIDRSFEQLDKPEIMYPLVIGTYRAVIDRLPNDSLASTQVSLAKTFLTAQCVTFPAYKDGCIVAGMTPDERAANEARQRARQQKLEQDVSQVVAKAFR